MIKMFYDYWGNVTRVECMEVVKQYLFSFEFCKINYLWVIAVYSCQFQQVYVMFWQVEFDRFRSRLQNCSTSSVAKKYK